MDECLFWLNKIITKNGTMLYNYNNDTLFPQRILNLIFFILNNPLKISNGLLMKIKEVI